MKRHVKGSLFEEYVRMIRKMKHLNWVKHLTPEDFQFLNQIILPSKWYPMESYQRLGAAIFYEVANCDLNQVRSWGRSSMDNLITMYEVLLLEDGHPLMTIEKFKNMNRQLFDFDGFKVLAQEEGRVEIMIDRGFGDLAMPAYSNQMLGAFERLIELSGGRNAIGRFLTKAWEGAANTIIEINWRKEACEKLLVA